MSAIEDTEKYIEELKAAYQKAALLAKECCTLTKEILEDLEQNNTQKVSVEGVKIPVISMEDVLKIMEE